MIPRVELKPRKALPFFSRHPWVLHSAIGRVDSSATDGGEVDLFSDKGVWIARGIYNSQSRIRVRLYSWTQGEMLDEPFWRRRLTQAIELRRVLDSVDGAVEANADLQARRLVYSEADLLSGLVVDCFGRHAVVQVTALALAVRLDMLLPLIRELTDCLSLRVRADESIAEREGLDMEALAKWTNADQPQEAEILEHGIRYRVDLSGGQKTGFYLDQAANRERVARYARGRRVLDICCYSGGFSLAVAAHGAREVVGVDTSEAAVQDARNNAERNALEQVRFFQGDMFRTLEGLANGKLTLLGDSKLALASNEAPVAQPSPPAAVPQPSGDVTEPTAVGPAPLPQIFADPFDMIILDPPKFVRGRAGVNQAIRAYHRLNRLAVELLPPGGLLVTCSCSGSVGSDLFVDMLFGVAQKTRREIQVLELRGASADHPVSSTCPETEYLKCVICRVL